MAEDILAYKRRRCIFDVTLKDADGEPIVLGSGDIVRVKIGRGGANPKLDLSDAAPTANGSTVSHANPAHVVIDADDLGDDIEAGTWPIEYSLDMGSNSSETLVADVGLFILHESTLGNV